MLIQYTLFQYPQYCSKLTFQSFNRFSMQWNIPIMHDLIVIVMNSIFTQTKHDNVAQVTLYLTDHNVASTQWTRVLLIVSQLLRRPMFIESSEPQLIVIKNNGILWQTPEKKHQKDESHEIQLTIWLKCCRVKISSTRFNGVPVHTFYNLYRRDISRVIMPRRGIKGLLLVFITAWPDRWPMHPALA